MLCALYYVHRPVDLLHRGPHRFFYAAVFGVMSDQFLSLALFGVPNICTSGHPYGKAFCDVGKDKDLSIPFVCYYALSNSFLYSVI